MIRTNRALISDGRRIVAEHTKQSAFTIPVAKAIDGGFRVNLEQKVAGLICEIAQYRGQKMEMPDALTIAGLYLRDLREDFPLLATTDIRPIFWAGVKKAYGEYYGINAGTLHDWTAAWVETPEGQQVLAARRKKEALAAPPVRRQMTPEEADASIRKEVNAAYRRWLDGWKPDYQEGAIGDELRKAGYISVLDPLRDLGGYKLAYLHDHGYQGTDLLTIYTAAKAAGKEVLL